MTEKKLTSHTQDQIKRKEPGILRLVNIYNGLCVDIQKLMQRGQTPQGAIAPIAIDREGLFKLDVDDEIWQDTGLDDSSEGGFPLWLGDESVRAGIKALLLHDHCCEEED